MGLYRLRDASNGEVAGERQQQLIESARDCFVQAASGTTDPFQKTVASRAAAVCSLLLARPAESRRYLDDIWLLTYNLLRDLANQCIAERFRIGHKRSIHVDHHRNLGR